MATKTVNVSSSAYTAITTTVVCREVTVFEDNQAGTTDYYTSDTGSDSDKVTRPAGTKRTWSSGPLPFSIGKTVGYVKTAGGSVNFAQEESGA